MPLPSFTFIYRHLPPLAVIHLHLPPLAFIHGHIHSLAFFYLHTPTSTTISLHLPSSTSVGFHDSPEIIQQIIVPSHYSFLTYFFPCPLIFRHYTCSKIILHFRETYRILHCFVIQQGLNEVYMSRLISHFGHKILIPDPTLLQILIPDPVKIFHPWSQFCTC